jgi:bifunctional UDP-N-acetylglucosamine pyrophosphorylase/glucosamine-1-phosphate N-acetyltransferase/UDP-N-acetylglucosamine pyrophosphorylase
MNTQIKAVILAAGRGKRLGTEADLPKVLREANGKPLLEYVLGALSFIPAEDIIIVAGYKREEVIARFPSYAYAIQEDQRGTGHAAACALPLLERYNGDVIIACGDMPLISRGSYRALIDAHRGSGAECTILSGVYDTPQYGYGRIVRDAAGEFSRIVEECDAAEREKLIPEVSSGVMIFRAPALRSALSALRSDNAQGELYLTDAPEVIRSGGKLVRALPRKLGNEIIGVNTPQQLAEVEEALCARRREI